MLQGHVPLWVPAIVGNWAMLVGRSTSVAALRQFDRRPVPRAWLAAACGALMLAIAATLFVWPDPRAARHHHGRRHGGARDLGRATRWRSARR